MLKLFLMRVLRSSEFGVFSALGCLEFSFGGPCGFKRLSFLDQTYKDIVGPTLKPLVSKTRRCTSWVSASYSRQMVVVRCRFGEGSITCKLACGQPLFTMVTSKTKTCLRYLLVGSPHLALSGACLLPRY